MTWCPCHGNAEAKCVLRGDPPIVSFEICHCTKLDVYPPIGRREFWLKGTRRISHQHGCPIQPFDMEPSWLSKPPLEEGKGIQKQRSVEGRKAKREAAKRLLASLQTGLKLSP